MSPRPARRSPDDGELDAPVADRPRCYLVLVPLLDELPLGLELELPDGMVVLDEPELDGLLVDGDVVVLDPGDADGVRSAGRSPTRSVRVSLQAVSSPKLSATAKAAVSILFMCRCLLLLGCANRCPNAATAMPPARRLTARGTTITNAE